MSLKNLIGNYIIFRLCWPRDNGVDGGIRSGNIPGAPNNSEISGNDSTVYVGRIVSTLNRSG